MGLGKTIVVISLVCTTLPDARKWAQERPNKEQHDPRFDAPPAKNGQSVSVDEFSGNLYGAPSQAAVPKQTGKQKKAREKREKKREEAIEERYRLIECRSRATLIVCPLSTVQNWESQFDEHTRAVEDCEGKGGKIYEIKDEEKATELRKKLGVKEEMKSEEDVKMEEDVKVDQEVKAEGSDESMKREWTPPPQPTKLDFKNKKKALSIYVYHGTSRTADPVKLANHDVVLTTFSTLGSEYSKQIKTLEKREEEEDKARERAEMEQEEQENGVEVLYGLGPNGEPLTEKPEEEKPKPKRKRKRVEGNGISALQAVQWYRVVLDEAQYVRVASSLSPIVSQLTR